MRISRPGAGLLAGAGIEQRPDQPADDGERVVRRVRSGPDVARVDLRRRADGTVISVTIASETTRPLASITVDRIVDEHTRGGASVFRTPAITADEAVNYTRSGFHVISVLRLLTHDLQPHKPKRQPLGLPTTDVRLRRARAVDLSACAQVDRRAFGPEPSFDRHDLAAALDATDRSRLRVVRESDVTAFAVTGRAGRRGYLQRLAVDPQLQGRGAGTALVLDALRWCQSHGARRVVVNTSTENIRALSLYRGLGFIDAPLELLLMERRV